MSVQSLKHLFTVDDYNRMGESKIFSEDDRVELIEGEIIQMVPIGDRHVTCVNRLLDCFVSLQVVKKTIISIQNPIQLGEYSEPQPDITLLKPSVDFYTGCLSQSNDVFLVVEVSDSSIEFDRNVKIPLYAKHEIPEMWLVDLEKQTLETYRQPVSGRYTQTQTLDSNQSIAPQAFPELILPVSDILG